MDRQELISTLHPIFSSQLDVTLVYLFGSQVLEQVGPMSDVDLGVVFKHEQETEDLRARLAYEVGKALKPLPVDLVILRGAPIELAYAVIDQGICIFQRDQASRVEFEAHILGRYGDYLPVLRNQRSDILQGKGYDRRVQRYREALRRTERTLSQIKAVDG